MKAGLVLVDIQKDYFPGGRMELMGMEAAGSTASVLLELFRKNGWPTFHIQHISVNPGATFFLPDTPGAEIHDSVKPRSEDVLIQKNYPNSFRETDLYDSIKKTGVQQLVICGAMSHMCIDATTRAAADLGFRCTVIHDGCATRNLEFSGKTIPAEEVHGSFMAALGAAYAKVVSSAEFISGAKEKED
jgi:nicotinamidase-related amidase